LVLAGHFSLLVQRKVTKRKDTRLTANPKILRLTGAAELAALKQSSLDPVKRKIFGAVRNGTFIRAKF